MAEAEVEDVVLLEHMRFRSLKEEKVAQRLKKVATQDLLMKSGTA